MSQMIALKLGRRVLVQCDRKWQRNFERKLNYRLTDGSQRSCGSNPDLRCAESLFQDAAGEGMNKKLRENSVYEI